MAGGEFVKAHAAAGEGISMSLSWILSEPKESSDIPVILSEQQLCGVYSAVLRLGPIFKWGYAGYYKRAPSPLP